MFAGRASGRCTMLQRTGTGTHTHLCRPGGGQGRGCKSPGRCESQCSNTDPHCSRDAHPGHDHRRLPAAPRAPVNPCDRPPQDQCRVTSNQPPLRPSTSAKPLFGRRTGGGTENPLRELSRISSPPKRHMLVKFLPCVCGKIVGDKNSLK